MVALSMTGFGSAETQVVDGPVVKCDVRSLNHRYLDIILRGEDLYSYLREDIYRTVKRYVRRGRIEIYFAREYDDLGKEVRLTMSNIMLEKIVDLYRQVLDNDYFEKHRNEIILKVMERDDVISTTRDSFGSLAISEKEKEGVIKCLESALRELYQAREREGKNLVKVLKQMKEKLLNYVHIIDKLEENSVVDRFEKLKENVKMLLGDVAKMDEKRLAEELAIIAEKASISEEINRLESHLAQLDCVFEGSESGKAGEFYLVEMLRELTTISAKCLNVETANNVVRAKVLVEDMREQMRNIE